jgi:cell division septum initiation protein DivIVA
MSDKKAADFRRAMGAELNEFADGLETVLANLITAIEELRREVEELRHEVHPR